MRRRLPIAGLLLLGLSGVLVAFPSIFGGLVGTLGGGQFGTIFGGAGTAGGGQFISVFNGSAGTVAGGQFPSIFTLATPPAPPITATGQQCNARTAGSQASVACTVSVTTGNTVVFMAFANTAARVGGFDTSGCADSAGNTYKFANLNSPAGGNDGTKMCYAKVGTTASTTFTYTFQGGSDFGAIVVAEFNGVLSATDPLDQTKIRIGSANLSVGPTYTTTTTSQVAVGGLIVHGAGTLACDSGYTQIAEDETFTSVSYSTCYKILSAQGAQTHTWTNPNVASAGILTTFSATTPGLTGSNVFRTGHGCFNTNNQAGSRQASVTCAMPTTTGDWIVFAAFAQEGGAHIASGSAAGCADSAGNTYSLGVAQSAAGGQKICYAKAATTGNVAFTWTDQSISSWDAVVIIDVAGLNSSTPFDVSATNTGSSTSANSGTTGTTATANEFLLALAQINADGVNSCDTGSGWTEWATSTTFSTNLSYSVCYKIVSSTGTQSHTWTNPNGVWGALIGTFKQ